MMDSASKPTTVGVNVELDHIGVCRWDGAALDIDRMPHGDDAAARLARVLDEVLPHGRSSLLYRSHRGDLSDPLLKVVQAAAGQAALCRLRMVPDHPRCDPVAAAVRQLVIRHRLGEVDCVRVEPRLIELMRASPRGVMIAKRVAGFDPPLDELLRSAQVEAILERLGDLRRAAAPLICCGSHGSQLAAELISDLRFQNAFVPDYASVLGTVGLLMSDIVLTFDEPVKQTPIHLRGLRDCFSQLMDRACAATRQEGYDLDDAEYVRYVEARIDDGEAVWVRCDNLADRESLDRQIREECRRRDETTASEASITIVAARIEVIIETIKPELPPSFEAGAIGGGRGDAVDSGFARGAGERLGGTFHAKSRELIGRRLCGPGRVVDRFCAIEIPAGGAAEVLFDGAVRVGSL